MSRFAVIIFLCLAIAAAKAADINTRRYAFCSGTKLANFSSLYQNPAAWPSVRKVATYQKFFINSIASLNSTVPGGIPAVLSALASAGPAGIAIGVEGGGLRPGKSCNGTYSAEVEFAKVAPFFDAGYANYGMPLYMTLDGPFAHGLHPGKKGSAPPCTYNETTAIIELAAYFARFSALARQQYNVSADGGIVYGWNEPVPWYSVTSAYPPFRDGTLKNYGDLAALVDAVVAHPGTRFDYFHADSPLMYNLVSNGGSGYGKLGMLMARVRKAGLRFGKYFNSEQGGATSGAAFHDGTLQDFDDFVVHNGLPDDVLVESWYPYPRVAAPEAQGGTFMNTTADVFAVA